MVRSAAGASRTMRPRGLLHPSRRPLRGLLRMRRRKANASPPALFERPRVGQPSLLWSFGWQAVACEGCPPKPRAKAGVRYRPYSLRRRVRRPSFPLPSKNEGMAHQAARHAVFVTPSHRRCGASRRAIAASLRRRAALPAFRFAPPSALKRSPFWAAAPSNLGQASRPAVSELLAGGHSAPGRNPGAARVQEERSSPARGRRIRSRQHHAS
jgi:hypothetical protein